jgi:protein-disulfide isomerase
VAYYGRRQRIYYEKSVADDNPETAKKYGVTNAPTLVAITTDGFKKYTGVAGIKQFIDENK